MKPYKVAPRARRDLQDAWFYSKERWGRSRAESYIRDLTASMARIAENPMLGQDYGHVRPGYRKHPAGSHMLFYEVRAGIVVVVRVLHQQMDVENKL